MLSLKDYSFEFQNLNAVALASTELGFIRQMILILNPKPSDLTESQTGMSQPLNYSLLLGVWKV